MQGIKSFSKKFFGFVDFVKNYSLLCHPSMLFMQKRLRHNNYCLLLVFIQIIASSGLQDNTQQHKYTNTLHKYHAAKNNPIIFPILNNVDNSKNIFAVHRTVRSKSG